MEGSFLKAQIERCFDAPRVAYDNIANTIFVTYSPSGGGTLYSIASGYVSKDGKIVVLGLDCTSTRTTTEEYAAVRAHILKLIRSFPDTVIAFIPENNLGLEAECVINDILDIPQVCPYIDNASGKYGITHTRALNVDYEFIMQKELAGDGIRFGEVFFTITPDILHMLKNAMMKSEPGYLIQTQEPLYIFKMIIYWARVIARAGMKIIK